MNDDDNNAFLDRLEDCMLQSGHTQVTVAELARRLKCSRRRLYAHAESKQSLFFLVARRFFARVQSEGLTAAAAEEQIDARIHAYLDVGVRAANRLSEAFQEDIVRCEGARAIYDEHQARRMDGLREIIETGIQAGEMRAIHSLVVAEMMLAVVRRFRETAFQKKAGVTYAQALTELDQILRFGLFTEPDESPGRLSQRTSSSRRDTALSA